ncbi:hypothetical protein EVAR_13781_1 [Eumeta japonica]|uniref:Uncharacterized protein n=1 Tax=Eumeta variegata TaxID=151549 RepID=A0A4C1U0Z3_EUMVA|nr:hypothetical protein EVAR_13781_1 [Eumeta japonica]
MPNTFIPKIGRPSHEAPAQGVDRLPYIRRARGCVSPLSDARAVATPGETALLVSRAGAGDARRSGVTHAGSGARGRAPPALGDEAVAARAGLDAAGTGQPTRRRNTVGGSRLCSYSFSQRLLHES